MTRTARVERAAKKRPPAVQSAEEVQSLAGIMEGVGDWRPQVSVIRNIKAVPTIFPQFNLATGIGGFPIERTIVTHGPSNEGKTLLMLGLAISYLSRGHLFAMGDAERTLTQQWVRKLLGPLAESPLFHALPVGTFEQVRDNVRRYCDRLIDWRAKNRMPVDTTALIAIDSVRKLLPARAWENLSKDETRAKAKKHGIDGFGGRTGQLRAALLAAWLDEVCPLMEAAHASIVLVSRETEEDSGDFFKGPIIKITGGAAMKYEPALRVRVTRSFIARDAKGDDDAPKEVLGERHCMVLKKTKIGSKGVEKEPRCYFHTSNGVLVPEGFDRPRDLIDLGLRLGVLDQGDGNQVKWGRTGLGNGVHAAVKRLHKEPEMARELEAELMAHAPAP